MQNALLKSMNPWWEGLSGLAKKLQLAGLFKQEYYFDNPLKEELRFQAGQHYLLRGPRQVGKTTLLKESILQAIKKRSVAAKNILFLSCENLKDFSQLQEILLPWLKARTHSHNLLCLDEVSFITDWQRAFLGLLNLGLLKKSMTLITGSNARDLKHSAERFPGRQVREKSIHPLLLGDYVTLKCFKKIKPKERFKIYMQVGGFPHAIKDYVTYGQVLDETYETYANWILGDAYRFHLQRETLIHLLWRIYETCSSRMTWTRLIENTPVKSHETAMDYVEHLDLAFLTKVLSCYDPAKKIAAPRKAKKIYFIDPLLYALGGGYFQGIRGIFAWWKKQTEDKVFLGKLFEAIGVHHLSQGPALSYFWYSTQKNKEVDLLNRQGEKLNLYEFKLKKQAVENKLGEKVKLITPEEIFV